MAHPLSGLSKFIRTECPGVLEPMLADAINRTVTEFLRRSEVWRHTLAAPLLDWTEALVFPAVTAGVEIPANTVVTRIDVVKYANDGVSLRPIAFSTRQQLDDEFPNWEVKTGNTPLRWTMDGPESWRIIPIATADVLASLQLRAVLTIDDTKSSIPDFLMHQHEEAFKLGTLARLMKIPGKDWTDIALAGAYQVQFENEIRKGTAKANAEYGQPQREVTYGGIGGSSLDSAKARVGDYGRI